MKVGELIEHLQRTDPELEVFTAPLMSVPILSMGRNGTDGVDRVVDPNIRYSIDSVAMHRDLRPDPDPACILIGFNDDIRETPVEEFLN